MPPIFLKQLGDFGERLSASKTKKDTIAVFAGDFNCSITNLYRAWYQKERLLISALGDSFGGPKRRFIASPIPTYKNRTTLGTVPGCTIMNRLGIQKTRFMTLEPFFRTYSEKGEEKPLDHAARWTTITRKFVPQCPKDKRVAEGAKQGMRIAISEKEWTEAERQALRGAYDAEVADFELEGPAFDKSEAEREIGPAPDVQAKEIYNWKKRAKNLCGARKVAVEQTKQKAEKEKQDVAGTQTKIKELFRELKRTNRRIRCLQSFLVAPRLRRLTEKHARTTKLTNGAKAAIQSKIMKAEVLVCHANLRKVKRKAAIANPVLNGTSPDTLGDHFEEIAGRKLPPPEELLKK